MFLPSSWSAGGTLFTQPGSIGVSQGSGLNPSPRTLKSHTSHGSPTPSLGSSQLSGYRQTFLPTTGSSPSLSLTCDWILCFVWQGAQNAISEFLLSACRFCGFGCLYLSPVGCKDSCHYCYPDTILVPWEGGSDLSEPNSGTPRSGQRGGSGGRRCDVSSLGNRRSSQQNPWPREGPR